MRNLAAVGIVAAGLEVAGCPSYVEDIRINCNDDGSGQVFVCDEDRTACLPADSISPGQEFALEGHATSVRVTYPEGLAFDLEVEEIVRVTTTDGEEVLAAMFVLPKTVPVTSKGGGGKVLLNGNSDIPDCDFVSVVPVAKP